MLPAALHLRSHYSLLRAAWSVNELVAAVSDSGYKAAALCDWLSLAGAVEFWKACTGRGIHPVLGCECPVQLGSRVGTIVLLAENQKGYSSLCRLITRRAAGGPAQLVELAGRVDGLIALTSGKDGLLHRLIEDRRMGEANNLLKNLYELFGPEHLRLQLCLHSPGDGVRASRLAQIAETLGVPIVAATEARYARAEDARILGALTSIGTLTLEDEEHPDKPSDPSGFHLRSAQEWQDRCSPWPEALAEAGRISDRCKLPLFDEI